MRRRAFLAACLGAVAGTARAGDFIDNGPPRKSGLPVDHGPKKTPLKPFVTATKRNPHGHTHTCSAGHSWDHDLNPGHTCIAPVVRGGVVVKCGLYQNVWDSPARMVPVSYNEVPVPFPPPDEPKPAPVD